jgi:hypothetical protein
MSSTPRTVFVGQVFQPAMLGILTGRLESLPHKAIALVKGDAWLIPCRIGDGKFFMIHKTICLYEANKV